MTDVLKIATETRARLDMHIKECNGRHMMLNESISKVGEKIDADRADRVKQDRRVLLGIISILGALLLSVGAFLGQEVWRKTYPAEASSSHSVPLPRR